MQKKDGVNWIILKLCYGERGWTGGGCRFALVNDTKRKIMGDILMKKRRQLVSYLTMMALQAMMTVFVKRNAKKKRWLRSPTQLASHGQWWS